MVGEEVSHEMSYLHFWSAVCPLLIFFFKWKLWIHSSWSENYIKLLKWNDLLPPQITFCWRLRKYYKFGDKQLFTKMKLPEFEFRYVLPFLFSKPIFHVNVSAYKNYMIIVFDLHKILYLVHNVLIIASKYVLYVVKNSDWSISCNDNTPIHYRGLLYSFSSSEIY